MKNVEKYTYLGEILHEKGLEVSALATINKRYGKAKPLIFEVMAVVEECRGNNKGAVADAIMLFEMTCIFVSLLFL